MQHGSMLVEGCLQHAVALLDVVLPLAVVLVAVREGVQPTAMHLTVEPLPLVDTTIGVQILPVCRACACVASAG